MDYARKRRCDVAKGAAAALKSYAIVSITLAALVGSLGCRSTAPRVVGTGSIVSRSQLSREELREALNRFEDFFVIRVKQSASELDALMPAAKTQRVTLLWRTRCISTLHTLLEQDDPLAALVDAWALSLRMTLYFGSGEGSKLFEPHQEIALSAATQIEAEIERIAQRLLEPTIFAETQRDLRAFALANPIQGAFSKTLLYTSEVKKGAPGPVETVISLPLAPFRAIEGVDRGAAAIRSFSLTAERFSDIVEELPESIRWQLLLLLYEFEESELAKSFLTSLERVATSSTTLTATAEKLPAEIRVEVSELVDQIDAKQSNMQKTLAQTQATSEALGELTEKVESTAEALSATAKNVTETATAWQAAAESIGQTFKKPEDAADPNAPKFSMADLNATAGSITEAAMEIRKLSEELTTNAEAWSVQANRVTADVTLKLVMVIGLTFLMALIYRLVAARLLTGKRQQSHHPASGSG